jgi:hypothetical protein
MAEMSMNKVIHSAVRRDLDRFTSALGSFPAGDTARATGLGRAWDNFRDQLHHHHEGEHEIAWPALRQLGVSEDLISSLDAEHGTMAAALDTADAALTAVRSSASASDAAAAATALEGLRTVTVSHLDHEESEIEPLLLANAGSPVLKDMGRKFGRSMSPAASGTFFAWLSDGASAAELEALTAEIPKPVVTIIGGLFGRGYRRSIAPLWTR